jgi:hypothetical protein
MSLLDDTGIKIDPKHFQDTHLIVPKDLNVTTCTDQFTKQDVNVQNDVLLLENAFQTLPFALFDVKR